MYRKRLFLLGLLISAIFTVQSGLRHPKIVNGGPATSIITPFPLGNSGAPRNLILHNGDLWFTAPGINTIGKLDITLATPTYTFYTIPTSNSQPYDLAARGDFIWFTELATNRIGRLDTGTGLFTEYPINTPNSQPTGISIAPDGTVWFGQRAANQLASLNPNTGIIIEYPYSPPPQNPQALPPIPEDVAVSPDGTVIWFTSPETDRIVSFNILTQIYTPTLVQTTFPTISTKTPVQVTLEKQGNPWISTSDGYITRYSQATVQFGLFYQVAPTSSRIEGLIWRPYINGGNQLWFTDSVNGLAGQLSTDANGKTVSKWFFLLANGGTAYGIVVDTNDVTWVVDNSGHAIKKWQAPYKLDVYLPIIFK